MLVELVVNDGAPGLALETDATLSGIVVTMCCFDGFRANGERGCGLPDWPELLRSLGLVVPEDAILCQGRLRTAHVGQVDE